MTKIKSNLMDIEIDRSTIRYRFKDKDKPKTYEIRGVAEADLARLRITSDNSSFSASATVQYQTHLYKRSHYGDDGKIARPSPKKMSELKPMTPYR